MMSQIKINSIILASASYVLTGIQHVIKPRGFVQIVPPYLPHPLELVYISGFCEITLGLLLLIPSLHFVAAWGLILLLIAVFPANIYLAQTNGKAMNTTPLIAWGRLPLELVFVAIAYWRTRSDSCRIRLPLTLLWAYKYFLFIMRSLPFQHTEGRRQGRPTSSRSTSTSTPGRARR